MFTTDLREADLAAAAGFGSDGARTHSRVAGESGSVGLRAPVDRGSREGDDVRTRGPGQRERWLATRPPWTDAEWWDAPLRDEVRRLLWLPAGAELAAAASAVPAEGPCSLPHEEAGDDPPVPGHAPGWPCACQVIAAAAWEAIAAWVAAGAARALVVAAGSEMVILDVAGGQHQLHDPAREELAPALRCTANAMGNRIAAARALVAHPPLLHLVATGSLSAWAARLVTEQVSGLGPHDAERVVGAVVARVTARLSSGRCAYHSAEINQIARAARLRVCPESAEQARVRSFARRRVTVQPLGDGMASLSAELAEVDAHRIHRRLSAIAAGFQVDARAGGEPDPRTRDQIRADLLVDLLLGSDAALTLPSGAPPPVKGRDGGTQPARPVPNREDEVAGRAPARGAPPPEVHVVVTLETLLRLRDDPAQVTGLGPIAAEAARALSADGRDRMAGGCIRNGDGDGIPRLRTLPCRRPPGPGA